MSGSPGSVLPQLPSVTNGAAGPPSHGTAARAVAAALPEDDGAAAVQQDAVLGVPADGAGQRDPLGVAAERGEVLRAGGMVHPDDLLLDDRALVEFGGDVVRGRADQLHPVLIRLVVGPRALEAGQEAVVDVDDAAGQLG